MDFASVNKKRLVIRIVLLLLLVVFGFVLFYIGKQHDLLLDNKSVDIDGISYDAAEYIKVTVDGNEKNVMEFYANDRDIIKVNGPIHKVKVEILNEDTEKVIKSVERSLKFGTVPVLMISLPAIAEGAADVYLPLPNEMDVAQQEEASKEEKPIKTETVPILSE